MAQKLYSWLSSYAYKLPRLIRIAPFVTVKNSTLCHILLKGGSILQTHNQRHTESSDIPIWQIRDKKLSVKLRSVPGCVMAVGNSTLRQMLLKDGSILPSHKKKRRKSPDTPNRGFHDRTNVLKTLGARPTVHIAIRNTTR